MTSLEELWDWVAKANALASVVVDAQGTVGKCRMRQILAEKESNARAAEKHKAEFLYAARQLKLAMEMLFEATGTDTLMEASTALLDIRVACQATSESYEAWRKVVFLVEVLKSDRLPEDELTLAECEAKLDKLHAEYLAALELALLMIPSETELTRLSL